MAQRRSSGDSRRNSSSQSKQHTQQRKSRQMGQSDSGRRQQGSMRSSRQGGEGDMSRQQSSQNVDQRERRPIDEQTEMGYGSFKRRHDEMASDDVEREGRSTGSRDDDSETEPR